MALFSGDTSGESGRDGERVGSGRSTAEDARERVSNEIGAESPPLANQRPGTERPTNNKLRGCAFLSLWSSFLLVEVRAGGTAGHPFLLFSTQS